MAPEQFNTASAFKGPSEEFIPTTLRPEVIRFSAFTPKRRVPPTFSNPFTNPAIALLWSRYPPSGQKTP